MTRVSKIKENVGLQKHRDKPCNLQGA